MASLWDPYVMVDGFRVYILDNRWVYRVEEGGLMVAYNICSPGFFAFRIIG